VDTKTKLRSFSVLILGSGASSVVRDMGSLSLQEDGGGGGGGVVSERQLMFLALGKKM
jgi:hypothetical protein